MDVLQLEEVDDLVNVVELLLPRCALVLTKDGRELQSFTDRSSAVVKIHLLTEPGASLETSTGGTNKSDHDTRLCVPINLVQKLAFTSLVWDSVLNILPGEDTLTARNRLQRFFLFMSSSV